MERSFVLVLTLVTLGTATPHGYGVKGGASAKAEASAVAGAFGDLGPIPLSIPSGSAYSGSFSKSSASSFASSSASSSSSSYSFSGSGAHGSPGIGTDKGCSSGTCPGNGATGSSLNGIPQFSGANAVSAAQAKAVAGSYTPCQGLNCNSSPTEKCTSGQCLSDSAQKGPNGCSENGNCQSPTNVPESPVKSSTDNSENDKQDGDLSDSDDFAVNINRDSQSKLSHGSNGQYSSKEKSSRPGSDCSNGNCGSGNSGEIGLGNTQSQYPVPSTYLTTPNKNPPCTTPNCNYPDHNAGPQTGGLPSSYNVPIQSATNPPNTYYSSPSGYGPGPASKPSGTSSAPCTSPNCNSTPYNVGTSSIPNYQFGLQGSNNQGPCASGQCDNPASSNGKPNNGAISGDKTPNYSHGGIPSNIPSVPSGQPGCTAPYCSGVPAYSNLPSNQPNSGCIGAACGVSTLTSLPTKPSDSDAPVYTGGFGGPAGFLDINHGSNKVHGNSGHNYNHNTPYAGKPTGTFGSTPTQSPSASTNSNELNYNNNYGSTQTSSNSGSTGGFGYNKPSGVPSTPGTQFNPSITGSYGAPTVSSALPIGSHPHSEDNGIYKPSPSYSGSNPTYSGGIDGSTGSSHTNSGSNSVHGSFGVTKPNIPSDSLSSPSYTGTFGGPSGAVSGSSVPVGSTGSFNQPGSGNCGSTGCNSQIDANANGGSTSASSQNKPLYNGGFGGPTGFLNPNNVKVPSNNPTVAPGNAGCANGNCGSKDAPTSGQGSSLANNHNIATATASANAVVYSGGFGGPPGVLKPYDKNVNIPGHGNNDNGHSPTSSNNGHPHTSSNYGKNSEPGSSGNGANAAAHASATASATAGSYGGNNHRDNGAARGCNSGCSSNGPVDGSLGFPGSTDNGLGGGAIASAKSSAGATAYGNFASSSASAHATAGAATKGGYGRK